MNLSLSLRELFLVILLVASVSLFLNIQASNYVVLLYGGKLLISSNITYDVTTLIQNGTNQVYGGRSLNAHGPDVTLLHEPTLDRTSQTLIKRLVQIERHLLSIWREPIVAVVSRDVDTDIIDKLKIHNLPIQIWKHTDRVKFLDDKTVAQNANWSVMVCAGSNRCPRHIGHSLKKVNTIEALTEYMNYSTKLCQLSRKADERNEVILRCPARGGGRHHFIVAHKSSIKHLGRTTDLPYVSRETSLMKIRIGSAMIRSSSGEGPFDLNCGESESDKDRQNVIRKEKGTVGSHITERPPSVSNEIRLSSSGRLLRLRMLVTSLVPLQVYIDSSICSGPFDVVDKTAIPIEEIFQYISDTYGLGMAPRWWATVRYTLVKYLTQITRQSLQVPNKWCARCFQDVSVDVTCTSIEHCRVLQLNNTHTDLLSTLLDPISITTTYSSSLHEVMGALQMTKVCGDRKSCLTDSDLVYLLDGRREQIVDTNWIKIYPSKDGSHIFGSMGDIDMILKRRHSGLTNQILSDVEQYYARVDAESKNNIDLPYDTDVEVQNIEHSQKEYGVSAQYMCSQDSNHYTAIDSIHTEPALTFKEFKQLHLYTEVPYDIFTLRIWAYAKSCRCIVKLDNKYYSQGARNVSLGLGNNTFHLLVIDETFRDPKIVSTVTLSIYRRSRGHGLIINKVICELKQDCSLPFNTQDKCGLYGTSHNDNHSKRCATGDANGRWVVPCTKCGNLNSCAWKEATWQPFHCNYKTHTTALLKHCLQGKTLLFLGDSTNRGIMNYLIEQVNGTLHNWDKIHTTRAYNNLNRNSTHFTFAYYPHFWLPSDHRPTFQKTIFQLIKSSLPLHNNSSTVLMVGGVQWLDRQHIDSIMDALKRKRLSNITVVIKGLGAGFHQRIEGVRYVPPDQQQVLQQRETEILTYAKEVGWRVVATFNMTLARYKDFHEGKCACHFHKVSRTQDPRKGFEPGYSISGDINAAYSLIAVDQMC